MAQKATGTAGGAGRRRKPLRVAIIGGGCAGMAAAWQLARQPGYEVHVFEQSWRLGGKCASGRDADGRIREHGVHIWLGFYENAFRMMRECYEEVRLNRWGPGERLCHGSIDEAFLPEPHIGVAGPGEDGETLVWSALLPPAPGLPGERLDAHSNPYTLMGYLLRGLDLLKTLMLSVVDAPQEDRPGQPRPARRSATDEAMDLDFAFDPVDSPAKILDRMYRLLRGSVLTGAAAAQQVVKIIENMLHLLNFQPQIADSVLELTEAIAAQGRKALQDIAEIDSRVRWKTEIIDIVITIGVGLYRDRVLFSKQGLDAINDIDYREWLKKHGATKTALDSRFIRGIYDFVFAYDNGDRKRPALAAGVALRGALRMFFTYRGAMFWLMRSGMGDAVFAPLYKVLANGTSSPPAGRPAISPVKFHFLHRLASIQLAESGYGKYMSQLVFATDYDAGDLDALGNAALDAAGCWPDDDRNFKGARKIKRRRTLRAGIEFDEVILATGLDDFEAVLMRCPPAMRPRAYSDAVFHGRTVATKAAQVWMCRDLEELGWHAGSGLVSALDLEFDTWADMTHTLASEKLWRKRTGVAVSNADRARSVAYFCGVLSAEEIDGAQRRRQSLEGAVVKDIQDLLTRHMRPLWPLAFDDESKQSAWNLTVGTVAAKANSQGSDRYTLSLPGSTENRLSPLDRSVLNTCVAGDWTACGLDAGCVEAAVISGLLAAHAITRAEPALESIIGYDHP